MSWIAASAFSPALPDHCTPTNDFLLRFSSTFHVCIPTPLAFTSNLLGALSICSWLFAQLPQIYKNYNIKSTSGLSIFFLVEWCLGDLGNLLGALFTHQAHWQVIIGGYYVFVDLCLVMQWIWYERLQHGSHLFRLRQRGTGGDGTDSEGSLDGVIIEGVSPRSSNDASDSGSMRKAGQPRPIFRTPTFRKDPTQDEKGTPSASNTPRSNTIRRSGPSSPFPSPSPRTMLALACLIAMTQASPIHHPSNDFVAVSATQRPTNLETAGTILSWLSTVLYLGSRLPQLYKNYTLQSTAGLSPSLFAAAFSGNLFYSLALATNPLAWSSAGPWGLHGWAGAGGSDPGVWRAAAMPFFLGAAGVLVMDASVGVQFLMYGEAEEKVVVVEDGQRRGRWRRVSGWMRGWVPSFGEVAERRGLLGGERGARGEERGYGALT